MPTILRHGPYRFFFYTREAGEPPHIHVARDDAEVKIWLDPVMVASVYRFHSVEVNRIAKIVRRNKSICLKAWRHCHD
jgi:hypothetical protein